ncbi:hypothetical protein [Micromonospora sp. WMMC250]|uniref:hypothetical protein n=1 Tax=Micromonospora sp. WMMC250 TaxID=3014781 RepID=UPI0022B74383|nr:hypothetical protein [Micromonospora sp. WMMC250]MCZ7373345.1 hypothetical protein [Micromonospora sp. WMMC250]
MRRRFATMVMAGLLAVAGATFAAPPPAMADEPTFCGNWLSNPNLASNISAVSGTQYTIPNAGGAYIRVNQGQYSGRWFAWAKVYNPESTGVVALIWRYTPNNSLYQCGRRDGSYGWSLDYTAGVRDTETSVVQAKYSRNPGSGTVYYGGASTWK